MRNGNDFPTVWNFLLKRQAISQLEGKCGAKAMAIVELKQPNYNATIEAIAQMSTKLTTHIEDFERLGPRSWHLLVKNWRAGGHR